MQAGDILDGLAGTWKTKRLNLHILDTSFIFISFFLDSYLTRILEMIPLKCTVKSVVSCQSLNI